MLSACTFSLLDAHQICLLQIIERGCALLGYAPIGHMAFVVLATRVRPAATLPGGHLVRLVAESRWLQVPLQVCLSALADSTKPCPKHLEANIGSCAYGAR